LRHALLQLWEGQSFRLRYWASPAPSIVAVREFERFLKQQALQACENGAVSEWLKEMVSKTIELARVPGVLRRARLAKASLPNSVDLAFFAPRLVTVA